MEKLGAKIKGSKIYAVIRMEDHAPMAFTADEERANKLAAVFGKGFVVKATTKGAPIKEMLEEE